MATVSELLPVGAVRLDAPAADWREAVRAAGELMVRTGACTGRYTTEMTENVEENGPYIVIAPGIALAHARPSSAVLRTGMSWVRLERPVEFGHETNDPVDLVAGLAAKDSGAHQSALAELARLLADPGTVRALREAPTARALHALLAGESDGGASGGQDQAGGRADPGSRGGTGSRGDSAGQARRRAGSSGQSVHKILTVCGNGLGTSLFLKNTLEQVLDRWGWSAHVTVEATDTVSAKGRASEAVAVLTSREIAATLGEVGVPVRVIEDFTSTAEVDGALRDTYDV